MNQHNYRSWRTVRNRLVGWVSILLMLWSQLSAAPINIANTPLFLTSNVDPNIMFIIDDSGSMHWEVTPDDWVWSYYMYPRAAGNYGLGDYGNFVVSFRDGDTAVNNAERASAAALRSSHVNKTYYNPAITYRPWAKPAGMAITATPAVTAAASEFPNAPPNAAPHHPIRNTGVRNLTVNNTQSAFWEFCTNYAPLAGCTSSDWEERTFYPAVYFHYVSGPLMNQNSYEKVEIKSTTPNYSGHGRENRTDPGCAGGTCAYAAEIQNFANWYTYYRSRMLASEAAIGQAFGALNDGVRVGFGAINKGVGEIDGISTGTIIRGVRQFSGENRENFYKDLYESNWPAAGTPLRRALRDAGEYFSRTDNLGPWGESPGVNVTNSHLQCRKSFTILMTDGYYNGPSPDVGDQDGTDGLVISGPSGLTYQYIASADENSPFRDDRSNTLADVAMKYWKNDLRPDLENQVPTTERNPAFWQHMVTYGVGLGVVGSIDPDEAWQKFADQEAISWPNTDTNAGKIDDLLHAAINSRGGFFSAAEPDVFAKELADVLRDIVSQVEGSATAAATSSSVLRTDTVAFSAGFRSNDWSGLLQAHEIKAGGVRGDLKWDAEQTIGNQLSRKLVTFNPDTGKGVNLSLSQLGSVQQASLNLDGRGEDRLNWLRGTEYSDFRSRSETGSLRILGDIIYSNPQYVSRQSSGYGNYLGYNAWRAGLTRPDVIYVGSNSGFLHAVHAETGQELFAYMPSSLLGVDATEPAPISSLMEEDYLHQYFMDGTPVVADAYIDGDWRTILVGTQGLGGRTVFALDVTNPQDFDPNKHVLWEFTHEELGYNVGQPTIVQTREVGDGPAGIWRVVFGNGYNTVSNTAQLFAVNIEDPSDYALIDTGVGSFVEPNGLASPLVVNYPNTDRRASRAYAGDLNGNLWRFNISSTNAAEWNFDKVFTATDPSGEPQPITTRPISAVDERAGGLIVSFGTGSFFRNQDSIGAGIPQVQSLYGIYEGFGDLDLTRENLVEQEITHQLKGEVFTNAAGTETTWDSLRVVSDNSPNLLDPDKHRGWFLDLVYKDEVLGERVVSRPSRPSGDGRNSVRFSTLIPNDDPCSTGRTGYLMDIDIFTGGRHSFPVFDLNNDGKITEGDDTVTITVTDEHGNTISIEVPVSGIGNMTQGEELRVVTDEGGIDFIVPDINNDGTNNPGMLGGTVTSGRLSWEQIR